MKQSTRILSVLLTLCLIVGSLFSFAGCNIDQNTSGDELNDSSGAADTENNTTSAGVPSDGGATKDPSDDKSDAQDAVIQAPATNAPILAYYGGMQDFNGDGLINIGDVTRLLNYLADPTVPVAANTFVDVSDDGTVDIADVTKLLNILEKAVETVGHKVTFRYLDKNGKVAFEVVTYVEDGEYLPEGYMEAPKGFNDWENDAVSVMDPIYEDTVFTAEVKTVVVTLNYMKKDGSAIEKKEQLVFGYDELVSASDFADGWEWRAVNDYDQAIFLSCYAEDDMDLYAFVKRLSVTINTYSTLTGETSTDTRTVYYGDTLSDIAGFNPAAYTSISDENGVNIETSAVFTASATLNAVTKVVNVSYAYSASDYVLINSGKQVSKYDATTAGTVMAGLPNVVKKDHVFAGYTVNDANGKEVTDAVIGEYNDLTVYVNLTPVNRDVTGAESGLTVDGSGVLTVSNTTTFDNWVKQNNGNFVIPKTVDNKNVLSVKLGAFANRLEIKALYIFDFASNGALFKDTITTGTGAATSRTFFRCQNLEKLVVLSDTVTGLGKGTFNMSNALATSNNSISDAIIVLGSQYTSTTESHWFYNAKLLKTAYVSFAGTGYATNLFNGSTLTEATYNTGSGILPDYTFNSCTALVSVSGNFTTIGAYAFNGCTVFNPQDPVFANVTAIGNNAFYGCASFNPQDLIFANVTSIGSNAFYNCKAFAPQNMLFPKVTSIGSGCFQNCEKITDLDFINLKNVQFTTSSSNAFSGTSVKKVVFDVAPGSVLPQNLFYNCKELAYFEIPEASKGNVTDLCSSVFSGCSSLKTVKIDFTQYSNFGNASSFFQNTGIETLDIVLNDSVTKLPSSLCYNATELTSVNIVGKGLVDTNYSVFANCGNLVELTISTGDVQPNTFNIGGYISGCSSLKLVSLPKPKSGEYTGSPSFAGCNSLEFVSNPECYTEILYKNNKTSGNAWYSGSSAVFPLEAPLFAPDATTGLALWNNEIVIGIKASVYEKDPETGLFTVLAEQGVTDVVIPSTVKYIFTGALGGSGMTGSVRSDVRTVDFSNATSLKSIGAYAFQSSLVEELILPASVSEICTKAFGDTPNLRKVGLPDNPEFTKISASLFEDGGPSLREVAIPKYVTEIENYAFQKSYVERLTYTSGSGAQITKVGSGVFANAYGDIDVYGVLKGWSSLTAVPEQIFYNCTGIRGTDGVITIPNHYTVLGRNSFNISGGKVGEDRTVSLTVAFEPGIKLAMTSSNTPFASSNSYSYYAAVTAAILPAGMENIDYLFNNAHGLEQITIPSTVTSISNAFYGATSLKSVTFEEGSKLTKIGDNAFNGCTELTEINGLTNAITYVGKNAFTPNPNVNRNDDAKFALNVNWTLEFVGDFAFWNCRNITGTITLNCATVSRSAFGCAKDTTKTCGDLTINFLSTVDYTTFDQYAFAYRNTSFAVDGEVTTELRFEKLTTIGQYCFAANTNFTSFLHNTKSPGRDAFSGCKTSGEMIGA